MSLDPGTRLGPYEILVRLGAGAMGEVYRARDSRLARTVAVKVLAPERMDRVEREARAISRVSHPHICALYDVGRQDGLAYLVMEHIDGETLARELGAGALPLGRALALGIQIADALDAAHTRGVIHRDLKPSNIMVTAEGVKLLDFGLAKLRDPDRDPNAPASTETSGLTEEGTVLGTYPYMAPEQVAGGSVDARADIFALGVVLYELATGRRPFEASSRAALAAAVLTTDPEPVSAHCPAATPAFDRLVARCLAKQPDARWQSARDLAAELRWIAEPRGSSERSGSTGRPRVASPLWWAAIGASAAIVLGTLAIVWSYSAGALGRRAPLPQYTQVTFRSGTVTAARFSADGETIVYSAAWQGRPYELFMSRRGSAESRSLGVTNVSLLAVSALGDVAFLRGKSAAMSFFMPAAGTLARVSLAGGAPRDVLDDVTAADWIPGTSDLVVARSDGHVEFPMGTTIYRPTAARIRALRVSPDGGRVALVERPATGGARIVVLDRAGRTITASTWTDSSSLTWSPDGREVWFSATQGYISGALWTMSMAGQVEALLPTTPEPNVIQDTFTDGRILLAIHARRVGFACLAPGADAPRELGWFDFSAPEALSADGRTVVFGDRPAGPPGTAYLRRTDGSDAVRLGEGFPEDLSPDGTSVLVGIRTNAPHWQILPTGAGSPKPLVPGPFENIGEANFLPDGHHIAFAAREKGSRVRIYVQDLDDGSGPRAISPPGVGTTGLATSDGRFVSGVSATAGHVLYPVAGGAARPLPFLVREDVPLQWSGEGRFLYVRPPSWPPAIDRVDMTTGERRLWRTVFPVDPVGVDTVVRILITPDGRSYCHDYARLLTNLYTVDHVR